MTIDYDLLPAVTPGADVVVRTARRRDRTAIRRTVRDAYAEYATMLPGPVHRSYLADLLDLDRHASLGLMLVAEVEGRVCGSAAFYPDASLQDMGWPPGWAGMRALAVHREARGHGVARRLVAECEQLARTLEKAVLAFHTAPFMTRAISLYGGLGFYRASKYDLDIGEAFGPAGTDPIRLLAFAKDLT